MHKLVAVIVFILLVIFVNYLMKRADRQQKEMQISLSFIGIALEKTTHRGEGITILKKNGEKFQIAVASDSLFDHVTIGDTILKLPNSNICIVKGDSTYKCDCYYFIADHE